MSNFIIDTATRKMTFLDSRFYQTESGNYVPSVTTILDAYPKGAAYYEWLKKNGEDSDTIRDEAGKRGSVVHELTERYDNGEDVELLDSFGNIHCKLNEWAMFERYVDFTERFNPTHESIEQNIISETLGFAGTLDRVTVLNGKKYLLDIKTSGAVYPSYWLQLAAYEKLLTELTGFNPVEGVAILWLNAKTRTNGKGDAIQGIGWQLITKEENNKDWELFKATHQLWLAENKDMQPRKISYKLNHKRVS